MRAATLLIRNHLFELQTAVKLIHEQPKIKVLLISSFSLGWLACLSWLFYAGFEFLYRLGGAAFFLVPRLFTLFFMGLGFMLMLSGAVTGYANQFQTPEVRRLLSWPVPMRDLFYYSLVKSTLMSSWAFFFIIIPFIGAFGVYRDWSLFMLGWSMCFSLPFVMLCSGLGVLVMLLVVRWIPRGRTLGLLGILALVFSGYAAANYMRELQSNNTEDMMVLVNFVPGLQLASFPLMPNHWMSQGILAFSNNDWGRGFIFLILLTSSVSVLFLFIARVGTLIYAETLQRQSLGSNALAVQASLPSRVIRSLFPGQSAIRAFGIKDTLIFLRDPSQWTQFLIFFGLLALYFLNLGSLGYSELDPVWSNLIAFLNMFSLSAVMSSLSARFVFPQMSLESRMLWMVGLAPTSLGRLMLNKFLLSGLLLSLVGSGLAAVSNNMLDIAPSSLILSRVLMPAVAFALAGMSTGLGAIFMELGPKTPAQILSGYGGTLNLILTLLTVILLVLTPGMVSHMLVLNQSLFFPERHVTLITCGYILIVSLVAGGVPLWMGYRKLGNRDF
ncbi:MAG: putative ABC transporter permease subunit [Kiritimatiellia bacterium]